MTFSALQRLQISWALLGLGFNVISAAMLVTSGEGLAPTNPVFGALFIVIYSGFILLGAAGKRRAYAYALPVLTAGLIALGVVPHLAAARGEAGLQAYASTASWCAALLINGYGAGVFAVSAWIEIRQGKLIGTFNWKN